MNDYLPFGGKWVQYPNRGLLMSEVRKAAAQHFATDREDGNLMIADLLAYAWRISELLQSEFDEKDSRLSTAFWGSDESWREFVAAVFMTEYHRLWHEDKARESADKEIAI
jgi:hypothetical protein